MALVNWFDVLGWTSDQQNDLRSAGFDFLKQGHYQQALVYFNALVALDPVNLYDTMTLGALNLQIGDLDAALVWLDRALLIDPGNRSVRLNRAKVLLQLGRYGEGLAAARELHNCGDLKIQDLADALILAYG